MRREKVFYSELELDGFWQTQKQAEEWECFIVERRKGFRCALIPGYWHEEAGDWLTRSRTSYVIG